MITFQWFAVLCCCVVAETADTTLDGIGRSLPVAVHVSPNEDSDQWSREAVSGKVRCVEKVELEMAMDDSMLVLDLRVSDKQKNYFPAMVNNVSTNEAHQMALGACFYTDRKNESHFVLQVTQQGLQVAGTFSMSDGVYTLQADDSLQYTATHVASIGDRRVKRDLSRDKRAATSYHLQLLLVFHYDFYKKYLSLYGTHSAALSKIRSYCVQLVNEVDYMYRISGTGIKVYVAGCYILTARSNDDCLVAHKSGYVSESGKQGLDTVSAIRTCTEWAAERTDLPASDHIMFISSFDLWGGSLGYSMAGYAYNNDICDKRRTSIVEDQGLHKTAITAAHELGHNLGSSHDDSATCSQANQNIMTSFTRSDSSNYASNSLRFSSCSISEMRDNIRNNNKQCLLTRPDVVPYSEFRSPLLGFVTSLNEQCRQAFGKKSSYCGGNSAILKICVQMLCMHPDTQQCDQQMAAHEGTPCADHKRCQRNYCKTQQGAPTVPACYGGDAHTPITWNGARKTCAQLASVAGNCDYDFIKKLCCGSCAQGAKPNNDVVVGNTENNNKEVTETPVEQTCTDASNQCPKKESSECYWNDNSNTCCASCGWRTIKQNTEYCKYGDRSEWCYKNNYWCNVEINQNLCCHSCNNFQGQIIDGERECKDGDAQDWCSGMESALCYWQFTACCATCQQRRIADNTHHCRYGDRSTWCASNSYSCNNKQNKNLCCATCADYDGQIANGERVCLATEEPSWCRDLTNAQCYYNPRCCHTCPNRRIADNSYHCRYGDRSTWCASNNYSCTNLLNQSLCCATCKDFRGYVSNAR